MSATDHEEQTECCFISCDDIADNRVFNPVLGRFDSVCDNHKGQLIEWIQEHETS